jgi:hypothetical protein
LFEARNVTNLKISNHKVKSPNALPKEAMMVAEPDIELDAKSSPINALIKTMGF